MHMTIPITRNLIIANVLLFLAMSLLGNSGINLNEWLGLHFVYASNFNPLQLVTYMYACKFYPFGIQYVFSLDVW